MDQLQEKVGYEQRRARARKMHSMTKKMVRQKKLLAGKFASEDRLKNRAQKLARELLRKKVAGSRGVNYHQLSTSQRIEIDRMIDALPKSLHKSLTTRLIPYVKRAEVARISKRNTRRLREQTELFEDSLRTILHRRVKGEQFDKVVRKLGQMIRRNRESTKGAKHRAASAQVLKQVDKRSGLRPGKTTYQKHARRHFRLGPNADSVRSKVLQVIGRAVKQKLSRKDLNNLVKGVERDLSGGRLQLAHNDIDVDDLGLILFEADWSKLDKLMLNGLVDKDKIAYYKRILRDINRSIKYKAYQKDIGDLLDKMLDMITKDDVLYRRLRFDVLRKQKK